MRFHFKIRSPQITAPLSVSPHGIPLTVRLAAKVQPGRLDLQKSPNLRVSSYRPNL